MRREEGHVFWKGAFWTLVLTLFLISLSVVFVVYMKPLYYLDIPMMNLEKASGRSVDVIRRNYDAMISYLYVWNRAPLLRLPDFAMSQHGQAHFQDVKRIIDGVQVLCAVTGLLTLVSIFVHAHSLRYRYLRAAGVLTLALPAGIGIFAYLNWDLAFSSFHKIFFRNNYWIFDPNTDPVILILPDAFFLQCLVVILVFLAVGALILLLKASRRKRRLSDRIAHSRARGRRR